MNAGDIEHAGQMYLLRPSGLVCLVGALLLLGLGWWALARRRTALGLLVSQRHQARLVQGYAPARARTRLLLAAAACALLALALAGPVRGFTTRQVQRRGLDLIVCLDTSRSMLVRDLRPDRLTRAKREVAGLIDRLKGDRVALVAFSGDARDVAPLTHDRTTLRALLDSVTPADNVQGGTDLGAALQRALALFDGRSGAHEAIVLLTDGEDLQGRGLEVAQTAAERGIRVYVVGMATAEGGKIPLAEADGRENFLRDSAGQDVVSALGTDSLTKIATTTGGEFLSAKSSAAPLEELFEKRISKLEGVARTTGELHVPQDRYQWALLAAVVCALAELAISERARRKQAPAPGVTGTPASLPALGLLACAWTVQAATPAQTPAPASVADQAAAPSAYVGDVGVGIARLKAAVLADEKERASELATSLALRLTEERSALDPQGEIKAARLHFDLGVAQDKLEATEPALIAFRAAHALAGSGNLRLDASYNAGTGLLLAAERLRAQIPEISAAAGAGAPPSAGPPPGAGPAAAPGPDPITVAMDAYDRARSELAFRLRQDHRDADTRANLELCQKRIRELEQLRKQQEQQQQEQQNQDPSQDQQDPQDGDSKSQDHKPGEQGDQDKNQPSEQGDQEPEQPSEGSNPSDKQEPPPDPSASDPGQEQPGDPKPPEDSAGSEGEQKQDPGSQAEPSPVDPAGERTLTKEEVLQLLDQLAEIEREGKAVRAALRKQHKKNVEKDW